ncbi:hypothetical protein E6O75_ATG07449 [Venturia nashicola]|uniref:Uncharacterized protein n=1 Tax=Venturia nashicola TaxID=86259 RepID=A0A4Z1NXR2_9PEZI|nr:hypothetical protein E6O75_ATG07449 [Venturia nashicola]
MISARRATAEYPSRNVSGLHFFQVTSKQYVPTLWLPNDIFSILFVESFINNHYNFHRRSYIAESRSHIRQPHCGLLLRGKDGVEVLIWSIKRNERFVEYPKPGMSEDSDGKSLESYIEVHLHDEAFAIRFSAKHLILEDGEVVQVDINWDNGLRAIQFLDKTALEESAWLERKLFSQRYHGSWTAVRKQDSALELQRLASSLGTIKVGFQIGRRERLKTTQPKYPKPDYWGFFHPTPTLVFPSTGKAEVIKQPKAEYLFIPRNVNDPGHVFRFYYRSTATLDKIGIKAGNVNSPSPIIAQTSLVPKNEPLTVNITNMGTSIENLPANPPATRSLYSRTQESPSETTISDLTLGLRARQPKSKGKEPSTIRNRIGGDQHASRSDTRKRARTSHVVSDIFGDQPQDEEEEEQELDTPRRPRKRKQKIIPDDTDDDEEGNLDAIARMRREMEAEAAQHHAQAEALEQSPSIHPNPQPSTRFSAVKIEAIDLTGAESTRPVKTAPRTARRVQVKAPILNLQKQLHLLDLKAREAKLRLQLFELQLQLEKAEHEDR